MALTTLPAVEPDTEDLRRRLQALYANAEARGDAAVRLKTLDLLARLRDLQAARERQQRGRAA
jgi:hypothetical protein